MLPHAQPNQIFFRPEKFSVSCKPLQPTQIGSIPLIVRVSAIFRRAGIKYNGVGE